MAVPWIRSLWGWSDHEHCSEKTLKQPVSAILKVKLVVNFAYTSKGSLFF